MPESPNGIAAVMVLYHPDEAVIGNVRAIVPQVDRLYIIDNTERPDAPVNRAIRDIAGVQYAALYRNAGVATALNTGVATAQQSGFEWVVTLDQDSTPSSDMVEQLMRCASTCDEPMGVIAPLHDVENAPASTPFEGCRRELTVITSGDLLSVEAWSRVGGFDESLFIDQVDHDFCLRLNIARYLVATCGSARMAHRMGDMTERRLLGPVFVSNHSPVRRYYITRNRLEMIRRYGGQFPAFAAAEKRAQFHELLKVALFERQRLAKLRMAMRGWGDFRRRRFGPFENTTTVSS